MMSSHVEEGRRKRIAFGNAGSSRWRSGELRGCLASSFMHSIGGNLVDLMQWYGCGGTIPVEGRTNNERATQLYPYQLHGF